MSLQTVKNNTGTAMSELNEKIKEIGSLFGITELPDNIGDIVSSFLSSSDDTVEASDTDSEENIGSTNLPALTGDIFEDIDMAKVISLLQKYRDAKKNSLNDKKIRLLYAVEPFLTEKRKEKISSCVKFLTFAQLAKEFRGI